MRDDDRYEIARAFDLLPHVAGASWASVWFRMAGRRDPGADEFRQKCAEFFDAMGPLFDSLPQSGPYADIARYVQARRAEERDRLLGGRNPEIEKRHRRYLDYG